METVFSGKRAVIVGGTGGIGRGVTNALVANGADALAIGRRPAEDSLGFRALSLDLDDQSNRGAVIAESREADILCVVRGPFLQKSLAETTDEEWISLCYANLALPGMLVSAALPRMVSRGWGRILLFGGTRTDSIRGFRTNAAYAAAKTGLSSLVKSLALEYAAKGVTCNAICPGFVDTEYLSPIVKDELSKKSPNGRLIRVEDVVELAICLMEKCVYNGNVVPIDSGWAPFLV
jgi:3-hydroxybutyrate dehydrogenase